MTVDSGGEPDERIAPVIPLFGGETDPVAELPPASPIVSTAGEEWRSTWGDDPDGDLPIGDNAGESVQGEREIAERNLTRKLRTRQLSVKEARAVVAERDLDATMIDAVLRAFIRRGYLDDRTLADQLVRSAVERKGQGRRVIAQSLAKRGIPRDVVDAALAELPDDDAERALEFARQKARSMRGLDHDVALRRLVGQLARRGYGAAAMDAARQALAELAE